MNIHSIAIRPTTKQIITSHPSHMKACHSSSGESFLMMLSPECQNTSTMPSVYSK